MPCPQKLSLLLIRISTPQLAVLRHILRIVTGSRIVECYPVSLTRGIKTGREPPTFQRAVNRVVRKRHAERHAVIC